MYDLTQIDLNQGSILGSFKGFETFEYGQQGKTGLKFIVEAKQADNWVKQIEITSFFEAKISYIKNNLKENDRVLITYHLESRENNGRWFTSAILESIQKFSTDEKEKHKMKGKAKQETIDDYSKILNKDEEDDDDLPF